MLSSLAQLRPIAELDGDGNQVSRFVYATHVNVPDYVVKGDVIYRLIFDHLGSPRQVINVANGQIVQQMDYDEYGRVVINTNVDFQPFGFAGGIYDAQVNLVHYGVRDYDADIGRWITKDPKVMQSTNNNKYEYALNNPIGFRDIDGYDIWIEGPSGSEILFHESINIGDPNGDYQSFSFRINNFGEVYRDGEPGGEISKYMKTTPEQDAEAALLVWRTMETDSKRWYWFNTCRSYSNEKFDMLQKKFGVPLTSPPVREPKTIKKN